MKQILTIVMLLTGLASYSQDTLCVMLTQAHVVHFDFNSNEILSKRSHSSDLTLSINNGQVMCLHLYDKEDKLRQITTTFNNGDHMHSLLSSEDNVFFSDIEWGAFEVHISESKAKE